MPAAKDFVIGHEPMGIVEEVGANVTRVKKATASFFRSMFLAATATIVIMIWRVNATIPIATRMSMPEGSWVTPNATATTLADAEYLRVPYGNFMPFVIPESCELEDEALLFLSDVLPTAYWSVENAGVKPGDTVTVLGCGPIGLMTQKFAWMKGPNG